MLKEQFIQELELLFWGVLRHSLRLFPHYSLFMIYSELSPLWRERELCHCHGQWGAPPKTPPKSPLLDSIIDMIAPERFFLSYFKLAHSSRSHHWALWLSSLSNPNHVLQIIPGSNWDNLLMSWCLEWLLILSSTLEHGNFLYSWLLISYYSPIIVAIIY